MHRITHPPAQSSDHIAPALRWAEKNLTSLARHKEVESIRQEVAL